MTEDSEMMRVISADHNYSKHSKHESLRMLLTLMEKRIKMLELDLEIARTRENCERNVQSILLQKIDLLNSYILCDLL